jgi:short-subunit dehydrogenase
MAGMREYRDRVGIVTGASAGIGAQFAIDLAARGMNVALVARRADRLREVAGRIEAAGGQALVCEADVEHRDQVDAVVRRTHETWGRVDLLINNAGYNTHGLFKDHDVADIERMLRVNVLSVVYATKAVLPIMRRQGRGWIVNLSSVAGKLGQPDEAVYSATKFAVAGLSEGISYELTPLGIHVMCVHPAVVRTEMFTPEVVARMPAQSKSQFIEPPAFTAAVLKALERGKFEVTVPRYIGIAYAMRTLFPSFHRRMTAKIRLPMLPDLTT